ncbi:MAG TPA: hypothetical protein VKT31_11220 [Solirubrobacteraceae bacterium]|nr:hypothetical protein [Solirubrobacteraceae bacterium]
MRGIRAITPSPAMVVATAALFVSLGGTSYAVISGGKVPDRHGVFHACVNRASGAIRIVTRASQCRKPRGHGRHRTLGELAVAWSQTGPRGLTGAAGSNATINGVPAGGALTGTYPSPAIAPGAVTPAAIGTIPAAVVTNVADEQPIPDSLTAHTILTFDTDQFNADGVHSTTVNNARLTAPISGLYAVHGEAVWASNGPGLQELEIYVNNFSKRVGVTALQNSTGAAEGVSALVHLNAGDYVILTVRWFKNGSTPTSIRGTASETTPDSPEFDIRWIEP